MSASMAEVVAAHYPTYKWDRDFGENVWICSNLECAFGSDHFSKAMDHVAEQLAANGYGKLEDASRELKFLRGERKTLGRELDSFESKEHTTVTIKYLRRFLGRRPE